MADLIGLGALRDAKLRERFKDVSREELELLIWKLELQNKALLEHSEGQRIRHLKKNKTIRNLREKLKNTKELAMRFSMEAHGG